MTNRKRLSRGQLIELAGALAIFPIVFIAVLATRNAGGAR